MFPYDIKTHFNPFPYPKGGLAPLRHELAVYDYVEKQRHYREQGETLDVVPIAQAAVQWTRGFVTRLFARRALPSVSTGKECPGLKHSPRAGG